MKLSVAIAMLLVVSVGVHAENDAARNRGGGQNQAGDSPFLDRASFVPDRLKIEKLDRFFTKRSEYCDLMVGKFGLAQANGEQIKTGVCVSTAMGALPTVERMTSQLITKPESGAFVDRNKEIKVEVLVQNLKTGFFDNPNKGYYIAPQTLSDDGVIEGHTHISVQFVGDGKKPLDAKTFEFFKGLNDPDKNGVLSAVIPAGTLKNVGVYRFCTISGAFSHQPVVMPVAQRGSQDDCIRVTVVDGGNGNNLGNGVGGTSTTTTTSKASTTSKTISVTTTTSVCTTTTVKTSVGAATTTTTMTGKVSRKNRKRGYRSP